jgi:archaellum component FlaC
MLQTPEKIVVVNRQVSKPSTQNYYQLKSRQSELKEQLQAITERREELAGQLNQKVGIDRAGVEERIKGLDAQITTLEQDLASVGRDVAEAAPASLSQEQPRPRYINTGYNDGDLMAAGFTGAALMLALFVPFLYRQFRRRRANPSSNTSQQLPAIGAERIDRMESAIDSIAVEIERVSENQRLMTRLMTETQLAGTIAAVRGSTEAAKAAAERASNA